MSHRLCQRNENPILWKVRILREVKNYKVVIFSRYSKTISYNLYKLRTFQEV